MRLFTIMISILMVTQSFPAMATEKKVLSPEEQKEAHDKAVALHLRQEQFLIETLLSSPDNTLKCYSPNAESISEVSYKDLIIGAIGKKSVAERIMNKNDNKILMKRIHKQNDTMFAAVGNALGEALVQVFTFGLATRTDNFGLNAGKNRIMASFKLDSLDLKLSCWENRVPEENKRLSKSFASDSFTSVEAEQGDNREEAAI